MGLLRFMLGLHCQNNEEIPVFKISICTVCSESKRPYHKYLINDWKQCNSRKSVIIWFLFYCIPWNPRSLFILPYQKSFFVVVSQAKDENKLYFNKISLRICCEMRTLQASSYLPDIRHVGICRTFAIWNIWMCRNNAFV